MEEVQNPTMRGRPLSRKLFDNDVDAVNTTFAESDDFWMQTKSNKNYCNDCFELI